MSSLRDHTPVHCRAVRRRCHYRRCFRARPGISAGLTMQSAAWALGLADRAPQRLEIAIHRPVDASQVIDVSRVIRVLRDTARITRFTPRLPMGRGRGVPLLLPESVLTQMATRPSTVRSWSSTLEWLPDLAAELTIERLRTELVGRPLTVTVSCRLPAVRVCVLIWSSSYPPRGDMASSTLGRAAPPDAMTPSGRSSTPRCRSTHAASSQRSPTPHGLSVSTVGSADSGVGSFGQRSRDQHQHHHGLGASPHSEREPHPRSGGGAGRHRPGFAAAPTVDDRSVGRTRVQGRHGAAEALRRQRGPVFPRPRLLRRRDRNPG